MNIKSLKLPAYGNQIKLTGADGKKSFEGELLFDLDHDGQISAEERAASKRLAHDKKFLNQLDSNHDGKVDTNELKRAGAKVATVNWGCFGGRSESIQDVDHVNVDPRTLWKRFGLLGGGLSGCQIGRGDFSLAALQP